MDIMKVYNSHKFTYTSKLLLLTIYRLAKLFSVYKESNKFIEKDMKIKSDDRRVASLLHNI